MISLKQHDSSQYQHRTAVNASRGVTVAFAIDHNTAGERLTQKCAKGKIVKLSPTGLSRNWADSVQKVVDMMVLHDTHTINFAGNGIYTWAKFGWDQQMVNEFVYSLLEKVQMKRDVHLVVSGGQSGTDLAGLIAAAHLEIPCEGLWPKGFKMRFEDGVDRYHTEEQIMEIMNQYA